MVHDIDYLRTLMVLHCGRGVWKFSWGCYYVRAEHEPSTAVLQHEVEVHHAETDQSRNYYFNTEQEALVAYCKFYKLGPFTHGGNHERSDQLSTNAA